jgi:hypothetical protein
MKVARVLALALLLAGTLLTVSAAYAASITMSSSNVMALGGTGQVTVDCETGTTSCTVTGLSWTTTGPPTAAPTLNGATITTTFAGTGSNQYTVYVTLYGSGSTVLTSASVTGIVGGSTSASVTISGSVTPSQVISVEVDIVQTA